MTKLQSSLREKAHMWRVRIDDGGLNAEEQAEFDAWIASDPLNVEAFAEAEIIWKSLEYVNYNSVHKTAKVAVTTKKPKTIGFSFKDFINWPNGLAAALVLFLIVIANPLSFFNSSTEQPTPVVYERLTSDIGEIKEITLIDGTVILLGPKSEINYAIAEEQRDIVLISGSAFFDVNSNGSPFIVKANETRVRVTGTAFDMQNRNENTVVSVAEGEVVVSHPIQNKYKSKNKQKQFNSAIDNALRITRTLNAGNYIVASKTEGLSRVETIDIDKIGAWKTGQLVFLNASLKEIIQEINRYSDVPITINPQLEILTLSATFDANNIDQILDTLQSAFPIRIISSNTEKRLEPNPKK